MKLGIMSFAHMHGYSYAACLNALPNATLSAVWDDDAQRGRAAAKQFDTSFVKSLDTFLASDLDGVIICSENVKHRAMVEAAAAAGKWILCEKPLATTVADAKAMIQACKRASVGLGTAFPCRYVEPLQTLHAQVQQGEIGRIRAAACTNNGQFPGGWFANPELSGGGAVMDHTVHVADLLRWITGKEFIKVYCSLGRHFHDDIDTDDVGSLQLEMEGGIIVSHVASWNRPRGFPTWGDVTMEVVGTKGITNVDAFNQKLSVYHEEPVKTDWVGWGNDANLALVQDFVNAIAEQRGPSITGEDGLRAVEVAIAAYRSARTGKVITI